LKKANTKKHINHIPKVVTCQNQPKLAQLARHGIEVHRFSNEVLYNSQATTERIYQTLKDKYEHPPTGLTERQGCFIATAAYGNTMAQEINILRKFRDLSLEPNLIGRPLVKLYYQTSPPLAKVIARSKNMKTFRRLSLKPIIRVFESRNS
jgi:hypothetical protein